MKNKVATPFSEAITEIVFGEGIDIYGELVDFGQANGIIQKNGAWMTFENSERRQGRKGAKDYLKDHPEICEKIRNSVKTGETSEPKKVAVS